MSRVSVRIRAGSILIGATLTMIGSPVLARSAQPGPRQQFLTAPYAEAAGAGHCTDVSGVGTDDYTATCVSHTATADASSGKISIDLRARSPKAGTLPGAALANGTTHIGVLHTLTAPASAMLYVTTLSVNKIAIGSVGSGLKIASGDISLHVGVRPQGCACDISTSRVITADDAGKDVTVLTVVTDPTGAPLPVGDVRIDVDVSASAVLAGIGEAATTLDATLTQVEAASPSLEHEVGPPFLSAQGTRSCSGSLGTTFTCRATAARTTGRTEIDLGVTSPVAGTAPGSGTSNGQTEMSIDVRPSEPVRAAAYLMNLHVRDAEAFTSVTSPLVGTALATVDAAASIRGLGCLTCSGNAVAQVVGTDQSRLDDDIAFVLWTTSEDGTPVLPDLLNAVLDIQGSASLDKASGQSLAMLSGTVTSLRIIELA